MGSKTFRKQGTKDTKRKTRSNRSNKSRRNKNVKVRSLRLRKEFYNKSKKGGLMFGLFGTSFNTEYPGLGNKPYSKLLSTDLITEYKYQYNRKANDRLKALEGLAKEKNISLPSMQVSNVPCKTTQCIQQRSDAQRFAKTGSLSNPNDAVFR